MARCVILGAGPVTEIAELKALLQEDDYIIAADGGYDLAQRLGVVPELLVADFDSAKCVPDMRDTATIELPERKDVTDTAAAVEQGLRAGYTDFLLLGCLGGRLDHEFANYQLLVRLAQKGYRAVIADGHNQVEAAHRAPVKVNALPGEKFSLFAFGAPVTDLRIRGASYSLESYTLEPTDSLCVSNEVEGSCEIYFSDGLLLIFRSKD